MDRAHREDRVLDPLLNEIRGCQIDTAKLILNHVEARL